MDALAHAGLAMALLAGRGNEPVEAVAISRRALETDPLEIEGAISLSQALAAGGEPDEGAGLLRQALARRPGSIRLLLAMAELQAGRRDDGPALEEGREALRTVLRALPLHPGALALYKRAGGLQ
jgi:predicted Zn-dependent protease